jgi:hypothetical protein
MKNVMETPVTETMKNQAWMMQMKNRTKGHRRKNLSQRMKKEIPNSHQ